MTSIAGVKWFHRPCRLGCSPTAPTDQRLLVPTLARATVRSAQRSMRLSGPRCSRVSAIDIYVNAYANAYAGNRWGYGGGYSAPVETDMIKGICIK